MAEAVSRAAPRCALVLRLRSTDCAQGWRFQEDPRASAPSVELLPPVPSDTAAACFPDGRMDPGRSTVHA